MNGFFPPREGCRVGCGPDQDGVVIHMPVCRNYGWRDYQADDVNLPKDTPVRINGKDAGTVDDYDYHRFPGDYPFLLGMAALMMVEVKPMTEPANHGAEDLRDDRT
jgi:hypothetical protein